MRRGRFYKSDWNQPFVRGYRECPLQLVAVGTKHAGGRYARLDNLPQGSRDLARLFVGIRMGELGRSCAAEGQHQRQDP